MEQLALEDLTAASNVTSITTKLRLFDSARRAILKKRSIKRR